MATRRGLTRTRPAISICFPLFFFIIMLTTENQPALARRDLLAPTYPPPPPPETILQVFIHEDQVSENKTALVVVAPNGIYDLSVTTFGTIVAFDNVVRESTALDSTVLGRAEGQTLVMKDQGLYLTYGYVLNTTNYEGSIIVAGKVDAFGLGELTITGGTGDFRLARGYVEHYVTSYTNRQFAVYNTTIHLQ